MIAFKDYRLTSRQASWIAAGGVAIVGSNRLRAVFSGGPEALIARVPDDAFYYMVLARSFAQTSGWTFDGVEPATGFHPLHGYLLALTYSLVPDITLQQVTAVFGTLGIVTMCVAAAGLTRSLARFLQPELAAVAVLIPFCSLYGVHQSSLIVEAPWVVLFASLTVQVALARQRESTLPPLLHVLSAAFVGLLGSAARTDFGLLPFSLAVVATIRTWITAKRIRIESIHAVLLGSVAGLGLHTLHTFFVSGSLAQSSAQVKLHWSMLQGHEIKPALSLLAKSLFTVTPAHSKSANLLLALALLGLLIFMVDRLRRARAKPGHLAVGVGAGLTLLGYVAVYRYNSQALQVWYTANLLAPLSAFVGVGLSLISERAQKHRAVLPVSLATICLLLAAALPSGSDARWFPQVPMMLAGLHLSENGSVRNVGSWNAGVISYFAGRPVTNLDGLVNDTVVDYIREQRLVEYLRERDIDYLVDFGAMFDEERGDRGGYDGPGLRSCLDEERNFGPDASEFEWQESRVSLYRIRPACLEPTE